MNAFKLICLTFLDLIKQLWSFPRICVDAWQQRRMEAERRDRIRNPSKYVGR